MDFGSLIGLGPAGLSLLGAVGSLAGALGSIRFVQESQRGVKLRFGRAPRDRQGRPKIVSPGFTLVLPAIHSLRRVHVRTQTLLLDPQTVMLGDRTVFRVGALVITRVTDTPEGVYQNLFEVDDAAESVESYCAAVLRDVLLGINHGDLSDPDTLAETVRSGVAPRLAEWGVEVLDVKLTDCSPTAETARLILIPRETEFRAQALNLAAEALEPLTLGLDPSLAAALIGHPIGVAVSADGASGSATNGYARPARRHTTVNLSVGGTSASREEED